MTLQEYQNYCTLEGIDSNIKMDSLSESEKRKDSENEAYELNNQLVESEKFVEGMSFTDYMY